MSEECGLREPSGKAAVITVGTELTEGLRTDTNGPYIARQLSRIGFTIGETVSVRDDADEIADVVRELTRTNALVVSTGGLGPTHDDVTREGVAHALGRGLHEDPGARALLEHLSMKGESASVRQDFMRQALVIEGAELIKPATGTAPAQLVDTPAGQMLVLPGPPHEMQPLLEGFIARYQSVQETSIDLSVFGMNETRVMHVVQPIISDVDGITFTVLASAKESHVILADSGCGHETLASRAQRVEEALGDVVFSHSGETLAEVVVHEAVRQGVTLATAESCTGGLVSGAITSVPGSSDAHNGGIVSYANSVKTGVLGVSPQVLATVGAVSEECAQQMAEGARRALGTTYAVSTTGIAGPGGGTPDKPVGTVCFGLATPTGTRTYRKVWKGGTRADVRARAVSFALDLLRRQLFGLSLERR